MSSLIREHDINNKTVPDRQTVHFSGGIMQETKQIRPSFYIGLFITTMATLLYQMLLTRIFSVTMWYHFAFVAVSLAMFGMTAGAIAVFLFPKLFTEESLFDQISRSSALFAGSIVFSLLTQLSIPFRVAGIVGIYSLAFTYFVSAVPFFFSGVAICLILTRFPGKVNRLYAVDLLGAGIGTTLLIPLLSILDGPTAVVAVASLTGIGAYFFSLSAGQRSGRRFSLIWSILCLGFVVWHTPRVQAQKPLLSIMYIKGVPDQPRFYEKWNAFSCIRVFERAVTEDTRKIYRACFGDFEPPQHMEMNIDAAGGTQIIKFNGNFSESNVDFLQNYPTNIAYALRPNTKLLVIGVGGGIDILSGLYFKMKKIVGVEINNVILDTDLKRFGDYTGHLDRYPNVTFVHDEGRSYITRAGENFDVIQANVTDTWAAGASGAFALTENSLYTVEAWVEYLKHLNPGGIITFTRWHFNQFPDEIYRLMGLAVEALHRTGVENTRGHILLVVSRKYGDNEVASLGTILVSRDPFTQQDVARFKKMAADKEYRVMLTPDSAKDPIFATIANGKNLESFYKDFPGEISPTTDNKPFFFQRFKFSYLFAKEKYAMMGDAFDINSKGVVVLAVLIFTMLGLSIGTIFIPLIARSAGFNYRANAKFLVYFASIGLGFMMVEISQLQRLSLFLGHPTYSLSVVLFSLLIGSGLGSFCSEYLSVSQSRVGRMLPLALLICAILIFGFLTPWVITSFTSAITAVRIAVSIGILLPLGFMMGMPFPLGMQQVQLRTGAPAAWFWGINGVTSVYATVFAVAVSLTWGISVSFWVGGVAYLLAAVVLYLEMRSKPA